MRESMMKEMVNENYKAFMVYMGKEDELEDVLNTEQTEQTEELEYPEVYDKVEGAIYKGIPPESLVEIGLITQDDIFGYYSYLAEHRAVSLGQLKAQHEERRNSAEQVSETDVENPGIVIKVVQRPMGVGIGIDETTIPEGFDYSKLPAIIESEVRNQIEIEPDEEYYDNDNGYDYEYGDEGLECDCDWETEDDEVDFGCQFDNEERETSNEQGESVETDETEESEDAQHTSLKDFINVERASDSVKIGIDVKKLEDMLNKSSRTNVVEMLKKFQQ